MIKTRLILPNGLDAPVVLSKPNSEDLNQGRFDVKEKRPTRIAVFTTEQRTTALKTKYNNELAKALVEGDPEFDLQAAGYIAKSAERIYLDSNGGPLYAAKIIEEVISSKNEVIETRPPREAPATDRGRDGVSRPSLRTVHAVLPHTALQLEHPSCHKDLHAFRWASFRL